MKRVAALRITGDICFFYAIVSLLPMFEPFKRSMALFVPLCLLVALVAVGVGSAPLRFLLSLVPGACFLLSEFSLPLIVPVLPWVYFILYVTLGRFGMEISDYRRAFRWMLLIGALLVTAYAVSAALYGSGAVPLASIAYLAAYLLLGVCALRWMQMGTGMDARWQGTNLLVILTVLVAAAVVGVVAYELFIHSQPILLFLIAPVQALLKWLYGLFNHGENVQHAVQNPVPDKADMTLPKAVPVFEEGLTHKYEEAGYVVSHRLADRLVSIGAFLILAFLVFIIVWLIVKLVRRGVEYAEGPRDYEATEEGGPVRRRRKNRTPQVYGRAQTVRMLYRQYLEYLKENGLKRTVSDTSEEIMAESARISAGSAPEEETLRSVYLKARYSAAKVTDEDVAAARRSLDAIRSGKGKDDAGEPPEEDE